MKKMALLILLAAAAAIKNSSAQSTEHLKLSTEYPAVGQQIKVTYDSEGTPLAGKTDLDAEVFFLDNKDYPAADIDLKANGKLFTGAVMIPANTKAFFIKLSKDGAIDNNNDKGYVYLIYKDKKPVEGAYALKAYMLYSGMGAALGKIKTDIPEAIKLYQQEFKLYPQSRKEYQANYAALLAGSTDPAVKALADQQIEQLIQSDDEKGMMSASALLRRLKKTTRADSLDAVIKLKFPDGINAKNEMGMAFNKEKDPTKKEALYNAYINKYPQDPQDKKPIQDNFRLQLASAYLQSGKYDDYNRIAAQVNAQSNLAGALNNAAYEMAKKGENLDEANKLSKQSLDLIKAKLNDPGQVAYQSPKIAKKNLASVYDMYADTYAYILYRQNKFKEAADYEQPAYEHSKGADAEVNEHYALILKGLGEDKKAMHVVEAAVKIGKGSEAMDAELKELYIKAKGSADGYDSYVASLKNASDHELKGKLAKEMINKPAPAFALKDFDGKIVSLADFKGKVVIIDFWATWCGPCKASFPGMQIALNKYKDNPNVKFLFIDTWERVDDYLPGVKKFIADNNYTFKVLMDEKGSDNRQSKVVSAYGVEGIPTKFILDGNGNIRFKHIGFDGSTPGLVDEVSAMIDMAAHPDASAAAEKVSMIK